MLPARKEMVHTTRVLSNSPLQNDSPKSFKKRGFHKYQTLLTCLFLREVMPKAARVLASTNPRMKCQHSSGSSKDTSILGLAGRRKEKGLATSLSASPSLPTCVWKQTWKATQWISKPFRLSIPQATTSGAGKVINHLRGITQDVVGNFENLFFFSWLDLSPPSSRVLTRSVQLKETTKWAKSWWSCQR